MLGKLKRIMNLSGDEIINHPALLVNVFDHQHHVLFWNKKCEEFFGIKEEEALGKRFDDLLPDPQNNQRMARLDEALSGKYIFITDDKYDYKNYYFTQLVLPLKNQKEEVIAAVNIVRFIQSAAPVLQQQDRINIYVSVVG